MRKTSRSQFWWEAPIEELKLHELEQLKDSMEELKQTVAIQANKLFTENSNSMWIFGTNNSIQGGVDHYEMKPTPIIPSSSGASHVQNYGYGHANHLSKAWRGVYILTMDGGLGLAWVWQIWSVPFREIKETLFRSGSEDKRGQEIEMDQGRNRRHNTTDCYQLKKQIEEAIASGKLAHLVKDICWSNQKSGNQRRNDVKVINMIAGGRNCKRPYEEKRSGLTKELTFQAIPQNSLTDEPIILERMIEGHQIRRIHMDSGSS
ncbi:hypothetical protein Tco_1311934 [Tanacetum coccineum]